MKLKGLSAAFAMVKGSYKHTKSHQDENLQDFQVSDNCCCLFSKVMKVQGSERQVPSLATFSVKNGEKSSYFFYKKDNK